MRISDWSSDVCSSDLCGEVELRVHQYLLSRTGHVEDIERVYSHGLSLAQCRNWLRKNLQQAERQAVASNAEAVRRPQTSDAAPAIAREHTAHGHGIQVKAGPIAARPQHNTTQLVIRT